MLLKIVHFLNFLYIVETTMVVLKGFEGISYINANYVHVSEPKIVRYI